MCLSCIETFFLVLIGLVAMGGVFVGLGMLIAHVERKYGDTGMAVFFTVLILALVAGITAATCLT